MGSGNIGLVCIVVFSAIFKNISFISWRSVHLVMNGVRTHNNISGDCTCSCKSNYHTFTTMTSPWVEIYNIRAVS